MAAAHMTLQQVVFSGTLGGFLIVVLGLASRFRGFRSVAIVVIGLLAVVLTGGAVFLAYWSRVRDGAEILLLPAIAGALFAFIFWVLFYSLRQIAKAAEKDQPSRASRSMSS